MDPISRRTMLSAAAGGLLTAATLANAQTGNSPLQPQRPGHGGTDPGPRNLMRDRENPDVLVPPPPITGRCRTCASHFRTLTTGWNPAAGPAK